MSSMTSWLKAARLRTLPLSLSTILLGNFAAFICLGREDCVTDRLFNWQILLFSVLTTLFLQILSNFANDYGDAKKGADNEERIGPDRAIQSGELTAQAVKKAIWLFVLLSLISGSILLWVSFANQIDLKFILFFGLGLVAIAAAIKYTVGKRAYGYSGLGDLFVFLFFGIVGVVGPYYLQTQHLDPNIFLPASTIGLLSVAVLNLNNMRDRVNDEKVGKRTMAVFLGPKKAKIYHTAIVLWAYIFLAIFLLSLGKLAVFIPIFVSPIFVLHLMHLSSVWKVDDPKQFDPMLKFMAISTFILSLILCFCFYREFS